MYDHITDEEIDRFLQRRIGQWNDSLASWLGTSLDHIPDDQIYTWISEGDLPKEMKDALYTTVRDYLGGMG